MNPAQIREFRMSLGLSAGALARALGVSDGRRIREWESGEKSPSPMLAVIMTLCQREPACREILLELASKVR